ncbi:Zn(II)2Cys6 transcription factor [Penicillium pulvis]|uniref:Zn(II)2Cys6 transcription factor n=1 Tax=Penicillium pulvis TaxID=1562058 RepID=UPI00254728E2|nr:Zn(II)2Cys6 transcription factor [Penicillium pulvis]KAJ5813394.1 Zn(II)2Cys6 transcription factor [Penicillium pulvis]
MPRQTTKPAVSRDSPYSTDGARSRVQKACDRCRRKKTKCDGSTPCQKCRAENATCMFGDRKRQREKVYPKGYTTFLEEQQGWLIHGLRELYRHVQAGDGWPGEPLSCEADGQPLVHDILSRLGSLDQPHVESTAITESAQTSRHQQKLQDQNARQMQQPNPCSGSHSVTSVSAPSIAPSNVPSPTVDQNQIFEAENTPSSLSTQDVPHANSLNNPSQLHTNINLDEYTPDIASHAGLLYNDVQTSSPILEYPTESDPVDMNFDMFTSIGNGIDDWEIFFDPSSKGQLSTEGYLTPFYDSQPLPFEYAA